LEPQSSRFWQDVLQSSLMDAASLEACWQAIPEAKRSADAIDRRLARQSVAHGKLTVWQAQQILAGRGSALKIGKYILMDLIGQGGMGRVFLAKDTRLNRRVAIKILSRERMNNPRALTRFEREAKVGAQLQHDNLVRIYDEGDSNGLRYLVMEYIEGKNVAQILQESGPMPPANAALIARQVAMGLEHARLKGLIHRDVNPQNILVTREGNAKLTDLGLAIDLGDEGDVVTRDGATVGTFDYISPEQARHSRSVDTRSDIYSLGCTLYHMISGHVPFPTPSLPEKLYSHQLSEPAPLSGEMPGLPEGLEAIVARMMRKLPEERYQTPLEVVLALEPYAEGAAPLAAGKRRSNSDLPSVVPRQAGAPEIPSAAAEPIAAPSPAETVSAPSSPDGERDEDHETESTPQVGPPPVAVTVKPGSGLVLPIDFGPAPPLSESVSGVRDRTSKPRKPRRPMSVPKNWRRILSFAGIALGTLILTTCGVWILMKAGSGQADEDLGTGSDPGKATARDPGPEIENPLPEGDAPIAILWPDNPRPEPVAGLELAIQTAARRGGQVLIGPGPHPEFVVRNAPILVPGEAGPVVIRAATGCEPTLTVRCTGDTPFLRQNSGSLRIENLNFLVRFEGKSEARSPTLIEGRGRLTIRQCVFLESSVGNPPPEARAIVAEGPSTEVVGCLFLGFARPIDLAVYQGARAEVRQSMFIWPISDRSRAQGWAIGARTVSRRGAAGPARLVIANCTVAGRGLIDLKNPSADNRLEIRAVANALRTDHVVFWDVEAGGAAFPQGFSWSGQQNQFGLQQAAWVTVAAETPEGPEGGPVDLTTWRKTSGVDEDESSQQRSVEFLNPAARDMRDLDPKLFGLRDPGVGADPERVGPSAEVAE
jgi:serine/threonine-protein kinase